MSDFYYPSKQVKARKDYECMACVYIRDGCGEVDISTLPDDERQEYEIAKAHGFKILKGEVYTYQAGVYDGQFFQFRGIPAMVDLCHKYDLFPED